MFCLFCTTPAEHRGQEMRKQTCSNVSRNRSVITWLLLISWLIIVSFGAISAFDPGWLKKAAGLGKEKEAKEFQGFGDYFLHQKDYLRAIAQYEEAIKIKPDDLSIRANMAIAYAKAGDPTRGLKMLNEALNIENNKRCYVYYNIAEIYKSQNRLNEAIRFYEMAGDYNYNLDLVYYKLGSIYHDSNQNDKAKEAFEKLLAIQTSPLTPYLNMLRGEMLAYENDSTQLKIITELLAQTAGPENLANYDLESITISQRYNRDIARTHNRLGIICFQMGNLEESAEHYRQSLLIWPGNEDAQTNLPKVEQAIKIDRYSLSQVQ
jgi:tetratricopeptide (TPR) repeat protein